MLTVVNNDHNQEKIKLRLNKIQDKINLNPG